MGIKVLKWSETWRLKGGFFKREDISVPQLPHVPHREVLRVILCYVRAREGLQGEIDAWGA